jgi:aspartate-semialdehyde dehydrogenase
MKQFNVGIVGATGAVGGKMLQVLAERCSNIASIRLFASERSAGRSLPFLGEEIPVEPLTETVYQGLDYVFFAAGGEISKTQCPAAVVAGCVAIDNSSVFRMNPQVPLIVPEVNPHAMASHQGIIANPNCSTIQLACAIAPIHRTNPIKRLVVSTYQSVSGTGINAVNELKAQATQALNHEPITPKVYPHQIAFNLIPQIDVYNAATGLYKEEEKVIHETQKILDAQIPMSVTAVRVPVLNSHCEAVNLELTNPMSLESFKSTLGKGAGIVLLDDPANSCYPTPLLAQEKDEVFVGRIREDKSLPNAFDIWIAADNLRKGAATNAVQIYQLLTSS